MGYQSPTSHHYSGLHSLRLFLAILVVWDHAWPIAGHPELTDPFWHVITAGGFAVWTFFFLSGFLVTRSWLRRPQVIRFVAHRVARIWPAFLLALLFAALLAILSSGAHWPWVISGAIRYIEHNIWIVLNIEYFIPGSFPNNPFQGPNGSLWTIPWEVEAYLGVLLLGSCGILRQRFLANILLFACLVALISFSYHLIALPMLPTGNPFVPYMLAEFIIGALLAINYEWLSTFRLLAVATAIFLLGQLVGDTHNIRWTMLAFPVLLVYFVGIAPLIRWRDMPQDWSYGVYIYAFPIEQYLVYLFPKIHPVELCLLSMPPILMMAALSWRWIEKPSLNFVRHL